VGYFRMLHYHCAHLFYINTGYFTSDNEPGRIENATHNTLEPKPVHGGDKYPAFPPDVLWVAFSIPPGSLFTVYRYNKSTKRFIF
jgi:hypothetical protein